MRPKSPCKKDCEGRSAECRKTCDAYKTREKALMAWYEEQKAEQDMNDARITMERRRSKRGCYI